MKLILQIHFYELRVRFIYLFYSFILSFLICFYYQVELFYFFSKFFLVSNVGFIYTKLTEPFFVYLKLSFLIAFLFTFILSFYIIFFFFIKSLYNYQIKYFYFFLFIYYFFIFVFYLFFYYYIIPLILSFFIFFERLDLNSLFLLSLEAKIEEYFTWFFSLFLFFLIITHFPIFLYIYIVKNNYINVFKLRKYVFLIVFILFIFIAPPDFFLQLLLFPFFLFFIELLLYFGYFILVFFEMAELVRR